MLHKIKTLLIIILLFAFANISCTKSEIANNNESKALKAIEIYLKDFLDDPDSYQFVSIQEFDSISHLDNLIQKIEVLEFTLNTLNSANLVEEALKYEAVLREVNELVLTSELENNIACYVFDFRYRANNSFGALVLNNAKVYITPDFEVQAIALTEGENLVTCNIMEEYLEIAKRIISP